MIVALLLLSVGAAGALAWQAYAVATEHRATAESVVRDYAALIADEVISRASGDVGYSGYMALIAPLLRSGGREGGVDQPAVDALRGSADARTLRAAALLRSAFQFDESTGRLAFFGGSPAAESIAWLRARLQAARLSSAPFQVFHEPASARIFVAAAVEGGGGKRVVGFEVDRAALAHWLAAAIGREPLVPPSLGHGRFSNASLHVALRDPGGAELVRLGDRHWPELGVRKPFGDTYQGVFAGYTVEASIDPSAAGGLIIGGLPPSRLPFLLGLLALVAGLVVTALLQLRRELLLQQLRSEFVANVSHELRTPLTQIRVFAETLLLERIRTPEEARRSLEIIDREARRLSNLVENMLSFSRAERGVDPIACERRELAPLVREVLDGFAPLLRGGEIGLHSQLAPNIHATVDPDALRQVLLNLLDNAVKYGPRRQRIAVNLDVVGNHARLSVEDEGPGIPEGERQRVFERFWRLERDRRSAVAGTGIGLSVVRELVTRLGGRVWIDSGERGGARVLVELEQR